MAMRFTFEKGKAYFATPTIGGPKVVVACTGRYGRYATFARVDMLKRVEVEAFDGRETARVAAKSGTDYFVSATVPVDLDCAAEVLECLEAQR